MYLTIKELRNLDDIQNYFNKLNERLIIDCKNNFDNLFDGNKNWLTKTDIKSFLNLAGYEVVSNQNNKIVARKIVSKLKEYTVSIIIPARNEEKNIPAVVSSIPKFGKSQEIIFVEGGSSDNTWNEIIKTKAKAFKQKGKGKANAVRLGLSKARGDILMIYDADRTVDAKELKKFYIALSSGIGEFINGSRLVYPMKKDAMRTLNKIGNILFSYLFTWILGQNFKDTLCGTKAFFKKDYLKFKKFNDDPFGDFELIFGAIEDNLKVVEIPIHYKERVYGSTNIKRFYHGLLLFKMVLIAFWQFKIKKSSL